MEQKERILCFFDIECTKLNVIVNFFTIKIKLILRKDCFFTHLLLKYK